MTQVVGIDVSKDKIDCCWIRDLQNKKIKTKAMKLTNRRNFAHVADWLERTTKHPASEIKVVMEATGIYHEPIATYLHDAGFQVVVLNPAHVKAHAKSMASVHKTDKKDSFVIAHLGSVMPTELWQPAPLEVRQLKDLIARHDALSADLQREKNRLEKAEYSETSDIVMRSLKNMIVELELAIKDLTRDIDDHIDGHPHLKKDRQLLESIPGVSNVVSRIMLCILHAKGFRSAKQLAAYLGLIPQMRESGKHAGKTMISKAGPAGYRAKLYMAAVSAQTHNPDIKALKDRLKARHLKGKQVVCAAMRKLVQLCFGVVKNQTPYQAMAA